MTNQGVEAPLPFAESICHACAARRYITTKTSTFIMCTALAIKYPKQPITTCTAYVPGDGGRSERRSG